MNQLKGSYLQRSSPQMLLAMKVHWTFINRSRPPSSGAKVACGNCLSVDYGITIRDVFIAEYLVWQTMAARGHMNGWTAVGGTGWSA